MKGREVERKIYQALERRVISPKDHQEISDAIGERKYSMEQLEHIIRVMDIQLMHDYYGY